MTPHGSTKTALRHTLAMNRHGREYDLDVSDIFFQLRNDQSSCLDLAYRRGMNPDGRAIIIITSKARIEAESLTQSLAVLARNEHDQQQQRHSTVKKKSNNTAIYV